MDSTNRTSQAQVVFLDVFLNGIDLSESFADLDTLIDFYKGNKGSCTGKPFDIENKEFTVERIKKVLLALQYDLQSKFL